MHRQQKVSLAHTCLDSSYVNYQKQNCTSVQVRYKILNKDLRNLKDPTRHIMECDGVMASKKSRKVIIK